MLLSACASGPGSVGMKVENTTTITATGGSKVEDTTSTIQITPQTDLTPF